MTENRKAASVRQRLLNLAQARGEDYNQVLIRYVGLRFLARLAASEHSGQFLLKGATMFLVWHGSMHRPTSDIDLLGFMDADEQILSKAIKSVCVQQVEQDGVEFIPDTMQIVRIREESNYGGFRCLIDAMLGSAKLRVQLDVGFGEIVTPQPDSVQLPRLLPDELPRMLRAYTPETVAAEKFEAIVKLGLGNSRMKDYLDLDMILCKGSLERSCFAEALSRTFARRNTELPNGLPIGLTSRFWEDETASRRWQAFVKRHRLSTDPLATICQRIGDEVLQALSLLMDESSKQSSKGFGQAKADSATEAT